MLRSSKYLEVRSTPDRVTVLLGACGTLLPSKLFQLAMLERLLEAFGIEPAHPQGLAADLRDN